MLSLLPCYARITHGLAAAAMLSIAATALAYPKPAPIPFKWELTFQPGALRLYVDPATRDKFWYFTYTVVNRTGKDQTWAPKFELFTDGGEILRSGRGVPSRITEDIMELLRNPFLQDQYAVIGEIHQGKENAVDGLAVWPARNTRVNELSLFIAGISGETAWVNNPATSQQIILQKTLQRDYLVPGDMLARGSKPIDVVEENWILR